MKVEADPQTKQVIDGWNKSLDKVVQQTVAQSPVELTRAYESRRRWGIWRRMRCFYGGKDTRLALSTWRYLATKSGWRGDDGAVISTFPFPNELVTMDLTGKQSQPDGSMVALA